MIAGTYPGSTDEAKRWPKALIESGRRGRPGTGALPLDLALALGARAALDVVPLVEHPLQVGDRLGQVGGNGSGQLECPFLRGGGGRDPIHQAEPQGFLRADGSRGEEQVLAAARPQRVTRRAGPTGTLRAAPGKRIRRLEPPTRMSQPMAISAPPPTTSPWQAATVGLGNWTTVVEVGEELHAADPALLVQLLLDVGARRETHVVGGAEDENPDGIIATSDRDVLEHLDQHLRVDGVAGLRPPQRSSATPCSSTR